MTKSRKTTPVKETAETAKPEKQDYRVRANGWVAGRRVKEGDILSLTEAEARYEPVDLAVGPAKGAGAE